MLWGIRNEILFTKEVYHNNQHTQVVAALILAAPLMWEGIDDVNTSFSIEYGKL